MIEDLANIGHRDTRHADIAAGDASFGSHAFSGALSMLKYCVKHRPGGPALVRQFIRSFDLSADLALADDHTVETGRHAEEMAHRARALVLIKMRAHLVCRQPVNFSQKI